jgi:hypothetical protein
MVALLETIFVRQEGHLSVEPEWENKFRKQSAQNLCRQDTVLAFSNVPRHMEHLNSSEISS